MFYRKSSGNFWNSSPPLGDVWDWGKDQARAVRSGINPYFLPSSGFYRDWHSQQPPETLSYAGSGMGGVMGHITLAALQGKDLSSFGLSPKGEKFYTDGAAQIHAWSTQPDNAKFLQDNRGNPEAILAKMKTELAELIPAYDVGAVSRLAAAGGFGSIGEVVGRSGHPARDFTPDSVMRGFSDHVARNSSQYGATLAPGVKRTIIRGMGQDLGSFYTKLLKDLGRGSSGLMASVLRNFSPRLAKTIDNLAGINKGLYLPKPPAATDVHTLGVIIASIFVLL